MTDLDVRDPAAKTDDMVDPALLAARMAEERAPDIVEAVNDMASDLAVAVPVVDIWNLRNDGVRV